MNVVEDIYKELDKLNDGPLDIPEETLQNFGLAMTQVIKEWSQPKVRDNKFYLRMSNIGRPARRLWFDKQTEAENRRLEPSLFVKFLYGHLLEEVILFLVRMSGHKVTDEQKEIDIEGIKGHMDCKIDGTVVDVKSASNFSFSKFKKGLLREDDPFGYIAQLSAYEEAEQSTDAGFLVINKETGELCLHQPDDLDKPNVKNHIRELKNKLDLDTPPDLCYSPIPEGKAGNMRIAKNCMYCPYKKECFKDSNNGKGLRAFRYAKGLTYFTEVKNEPKVDEVYEW
jgi:hypothetical protein